MPSGLGDGAHDGLRHDIRGERADHSRIHVGRNRARGERKNRVAVRGSMCGINRARVAVVRHLRDLGRLILVELRIGSHHADRRVGAVFAHDHLVAAANLLHGISKILTIFGPRPGDDLRGMRVVDVSHGVDRNHCGNHHPRVADVDAGCAESALHGVLWTKHFPDRRSRTCSDVPFRDLSGRRRHTSLIAGFSRRADFPVAADAEVKQNGCGNDRHDDRWTHVVADPFSIEVAHDAGGGVETEGAAAAQRQAEDLLHRVNGTQQVCFTRSRSAATHVHAARRAFLAQDHGAAGGSPLIRKVADF